MTPATFDLTIRKGVVFGPVTITCQDADDEVVDLTGWNAFAEVKASARNPLVVDLQPEITDAEGGVITIELSVEEIAELPDGTYQWDLVVARPSGERIGALVEGTVTVKTLMTQP